MVNTLNAKDKSANISEVINKLMQVRFFNRFDTGELHILGKHIKIVYLSKGEELFYEGGPGNSVCFLVSGELAVIKESKNGSTTEIVALSKGRSIGEMSILDECSRSATVKASENCTLIVLHKKDYQYILDHHPNIGIKLLKGFSRLVSLNLRRTTSQLAN